MERELTRKSDRQVTVKKRNDLIDGAPKMPGEKVYPGINWTRINPVSVGWDEDKLNLAKEYFEQLNADACMVVQNGYVIAAWGDISTPVQNRSIRKSFLGTLMGIYHGKGQIQLNETLGEMGIDEKGGLSEIEKSATVETLLASRSCIFLPAAYDPNEHPERGTYKPNEAWHYNNWDFNTLGTIFEKKTGGKIFEAYQNDLAMPLQMQDFSIHNTEYRYERISSHPAYLFETSARDDARMGLLWLNNGRWMDKQIVPADWMEKSTSVVTDLKGKMRLSLRDGYGYLFWIDKDDLNNVIGFSALGASGQFIYVSPRHDLVIVVRADPGTVFKKWFGLRLEPKDSYKLVDYIIHAAPRI
jgi:CubicO group peptidase (beta-lactamase class C family)